MKRTRLSDIYGDKRIHYSKPCAINKCICAKCVYGERRRGIGIIWEKSPRLEFGRLFLSVRRLSALCCTATTILRRSTTDAFYGHGVTANRKNDGIHIGHVVYDDTCN